MAYIDSEAFKRKLIDEKGFFPAIVARALEEMPDADVAEVNRGYWIPCCDEPKLTRISAGISKVWVECSECHTKGEENWKRCPICEAKMDGGKTK